MPQYNLNKMQRTLVFPVILPEDSTYVLTSLLFSRLTRHYLHKLCEA